MSEHPSRHNFPAFLAFAAFPSARATLGLAAGLCLLAGSAAAQSTVTIYGRINTALEHVSASRSPVSLTQTRLTSNRSVVGFSGAEDLGGGLKTIWQIEGGFALDTGTGSLFNRDTRVGLAGDFGTLFVGVWALPYTAATAGFDPFYPTTAGYMAIMGNGSAPTTDNVIDTSSFDRRQRNQIQYWSPKLGGFSARLAYGFNEERVGAARPSLLSMAGTYEDGPLQLTAAHEIHHEYQAASTSDKAYKLGAAYQFGPARLAAVVERLHYETATGVLNRNAWYVSAIYQLCVGSLRAGYSRAGDGHGSAKEKVGFFSSGANTGSSQLTVGYEYPLSKRTAVYSYYSSIRNKSAARYDFAINELGIAPGARPSAFALGLRHNF